MNLLDTEIIKALECCINDDCDNCPMVNNCPSYYELLKRTLDLTNRQQAEIEKLKEIATKRLKVYHEKMKECQVWQDFHKPLKPNNRAMAAGCRVGICPRCETIVASTSIHNKSYCNTCGQALDWSEEEE